MKNENKPANPTKAVVFPSLEVFDYESEEVRGHLVYQFPGETKMEKAFWQVYSSMLSNPNVEPRMMSEQGIDRLAKDALNVTLAGFKTLKDNQ